MGPKLSKLYSPSKKVGRLVAVDETVVKFNWNRCCLWAAIDVDSREDPAVYAFKGRSMLNTLTFLKKVLKTCDNKPVIVVDGVHGIHGALRRLG